MKKVHLEVEFAFETGYTTENCCRNAKRLLTKQNEENPAGDTKEKEKNKLFGGLKYGSAGHREKRKVHDSKDFTQTAI